MLRGAHRGTHGSPREFALSSNVAVGEGGGSIGGEGGCGKGGDRGKGDGGGGVTWTWTSMTIGVAGGSSMVIPNTLLIASRAFVCKATAADPT